MTGTKEALRRFLRENPAEPDSGAICQRILAHPWYQRAEVIMAFVPKAPEPDITPVLADILTRGKILLLPRCETDGTMTAREIRNLSLLQAGAFGLKEPSAEAAVFPPAEIDLILVPGMAFDEQCHRLGHGRGYYDKFLVNTNAKTIGVAGRLVPAVPTHSTDRDMDCLVTDTMTILCDRRTPHVGREAEKE